MKIVIILFLNIGDECQSWNGNPIKAMVRLWVELLEILTTNDDDDDDVVVDDDDDDVVMLTMIDGDDNEWR